ncbi:MAG: hypothetical protein A3F13_04115 [Gammaproteobacteria bacterium RIFCSPHIGHO2_12_FULL_40_19]|nr:MAG: hypothetical protein A3F13_04115 [Gammaproteobacteria bacterium RIFCSPHIGHO2_12_FULL_40_19]
MKKKLTIISLITLALSITGCSVAFADSAEPSAFCPHKNDIQKNPVKGNWIAHTKAGDWKSYDMSFATNLTQFVGAQWSGANVGQLTCVYHSEQQFKMQGKPAVQPTLPVLLIFHTLTFQPAKGKWKHAARGIYNCYSTKQSDCPFKMNIKSSVGNVYQEAAALKYDNTDKADPLQQPPSY